MRQGTPVRSVIIEAMERIALEEKKHLRPLEDEASLLTIGLDSLCFAILISRLEAELGVDPFDGSEDFALPTTLGELIHFYETVSAGPPPVGYGSRPTIA